MIQVYVKLKDIKLRSETHVTKDGQVYPGRKVNSVSDFSDADEAVLLEHNMNCYDAFLKDVAMNGIKYALTVRTDGTLDDGYCRFRIAELLGLEYVPINLEYFIGKQPTIYPKIEVIR